MAAATAHRQVAFTVHPIKRAPLPTPRGEFKAHGESHLYHGTLTPPASQPHHGGTREFRPLVQVLDAHTNPWVTQGGQTDLAAMVMGTVRGLTPPLHRLVEVMQKQGTCHRLISSARCYAPCLRAATVDAASSNSSSSSASKPSSCLPS